MNKGDKNLATYDVFYICFHNTGIGLISTFSFSLVSIPFWSGANKFRMLLEKICKFLTNKVYYSFI